MCPQAVNNYYLFTRLSIDSLVPSMIFNFEELIENEIYGIYLLKNELKNIVGYRAFHRKSYIKSTDISTLL